MRLRSSSSIDSLLALAPPPPPPKAIQWLNSVKSEPLAIASLSESALPFIYFLQGTDRMSFTSHVSSASPTTLFYLYFHLCTIVSVLPSGLLDRTWVPTDSD